MSERRELYVPNGMRIVAPDEINRPALSVLHEVIPRAVSGNDEFIPAMRKIDRLLKRFGVTYTEEEALGLFNRFCQSEEYVYQPDFLKLLDTANVTPDQVLHIGFITQIMRDVEYIARRKKQSPSVVHPLTYMDMYNEPRVLHVGRHRLKSEQQDTWSLLHASDGVEYITSREVDPSLVIRIVKDTAAKTAPLTRDEVKRVLFSEQLTGSFFEGGDMARMFIQLPASRKLQYAQGVYALVHEQAHARQPHMFSLVMEVDAIRNVVSGLRSIYFRHPDKDERYQLFNLLRNEESYLCNLLARIGNSDVSVDHNLKIDIEATNMSFAS